VLLLLVSLAAPARDGGVRPARTIEGLRLLYFHAGWCPSCKRFDASGTLARVRVALPNLAQVDVDADTERARLEQYGVQGIPALVLVDEEGFPLGRPRLELDDGPKNAETIERLVKKMAR